MPSQPPTPYERQFDFTDWERTQPAKPLPGSKVDLELNEAKAAINETITRLNLIQRDDGNIRPEQLNPALAQAELERRMAQAARTDATIAKVETEAVRDEVVGLINGIHSEVASDLDAAQAALAATDAALGTMTEQLAEATTASTAAAGSAAASASSAVDAASAASAAGASASSAENNAAVAASSATSAANSAAAAAASEASITVGLASKLTNTINWVGVYDNGVTYAAGDGVVFNGSVYVLKEFIGGAGYDPAGYGASWTKLLPDNFGGSGNPFDQNLNTTNDVTFNSVVANSINSAGEIGIGPDGLLRLGGSGFDTTLGWNGLVFGAAGTDPTLTPTLLRLMPGGVITFGDGTTQSTAGGYDQSLNTTSSPAFTGLELNLTGVIFYTSGSGIHLVNASNNLGFHFDVDTSTGATQFAVGNSLTGIGVTIKDTGIVFPDGSVQTTSATGIDLSAYATTSWVTSQGYLTSTNLTGYATQSWVNSQGFLTSSSLTGYATQSWVGSQGYITSSSLTGLMVKANNLSDLNNAATARTNLGLGSAATQASSAFAAASHTHTASQVTDFSTAADARVAAAANSTAGTISMAGAQSAGTSSLFARADHVHPTDTSRAPVASPSFTGNASATGDVSAGGNLVSNNSVGNEGGEVQLAKPATGSTLAGAVSVDIYQNKIRFFENGGSSRGAYIDLTATGGSVGTNLLAGSSAATTSTAGVVQLSDYAASVAGTSQTLANTPYGATLRHLQLSNVPLSVYGFSVSTSGTGASVSFTGNPNRSISAPTSATGQAIAYILLYHISGPYSAGGAYNLGFNWSKFVALSFRFALNSLPTDSQTIFRALVGGRSNAAGTTPGDLGSKGICVKIAGNGAMILQVHNGTTLTNVTSSLTPIGRTYDIRVESDGAGNVTLYNDNTAIATTSAGPTGAGTSLCNMVVFECQNTGTISGSAMSLNIGAINFFTAL